MTVVKQRQRRGSLALWLGLGLLGIYLVLGVVVFFAGSSYYDEDRIQELQQTTFHEHTVDSQAWAQWRGPLREGVAQGKDLLQQWPDDLLATRKVWEQPVGAGFSSLAVADNRVFTLCQDDAYEAVVCWSADKGQELWRYRYSAQFLDQYGNGPRSTPAVDGDVVYTVGATGIMHCLKTQPASAAGEVVWSKDLLADFGARNRRWGVSFSPLVLGDLVVVVPGGPVGKCLAALDKRDGKVVWQALSDSPGYSSPMAATIAGKPQLVFVSGERVVGLSPMDGTLYWEHPWPVQDGINIATPIVAGDCVFVCSGYGQGGALLKIEQGAGTGLKAHVCYHSRRLRSHFSSPVRWQDHLFVFDEAALVCVNLKTGQEAWRQARIGKGSLVVADGLLIILDEGSRLILAEATPEAFRVRGQVQLGEERGRTWTAPALANGLLYVRDVDRIVCLNLSRAP
jgi:outer membrane protein assembly factor BamB